MSLKGKTLFITAARAALGWRSRSRPPPDGANIAIAG